MAKAEEQQVEGIVLNDRTPSQNYSRNARFACRRSLT